MSTGSTEHPDYDTHESMKVLRERNAALARIAELEAENERLSEIIARTAGLLSSAQAPLSIITDELDSYIASRSQLD